MFTPAMRAKLQSLLTAAESAKSASGPAASAAAGADHASFAEEAVIGMIAPTSTPNFDKTHRTACPVGRSST
jgi:hypothetical protein